MKNPIDIFKKYENEERFSLSDISKELKILDEKVIECRYDRYAIGLHINDRGFGLKQEDFIDKEDIEMFFKHLKTQVSKITNTRILTRYYKLLWKYENELLKISKNDIYRKEMKKNICLSIKNKKFKDNYGIEDFLEKAFQELEKSDEFKEDVINLIITRGIEHTNCSWAYKLINNSKLVSQEKKEEVLLKLREEFNHLASLDDTNDEFLESSKLLMKNFKTNKKEIENLINKIITHFETLKNDPFKTKIYIEDLLYSIKELKFKNNIGKEGIDKLKLISEKLGGKIDLQEFSEKIEISDDEMKEIKNKFIRKNFKESIRKIMEDYLEIFKKINEDYEKLNINSLDSTIPITILDNKGRTIKTAESEDEKIKFYFTQSAPIYYQFFCFNLDGIFEHFNVNKNSFDYLIDKCTISDNNDKQILKKAIPFFLNKDYIVFLHLVIPRIENILRNFLKNLGGTTLGQTTNNGFKYKIFGEILEDQLIKETFTEDIISHLKLVLSDDYGLNIRNNLSHGIINLGECNKINSYIVFHILLFLMHI
jgi:hypothetical protein